MEQECKEESPVSYDRVLLVVKECLSVRKGWWELNV